MDSSVSIFSQCIQQTFIMQSIVLESGIKRKKKKNPRHSIYHQGLQILVEKLDKKITRWEMMEWGGAQGVLEIQKKSTEESHLTSRETPPHERTLRDKEKGARWKGKDKWHSKYSLFRNVHPNCLSKKKKKQVEWACLRAVFLNLLRSAESPKAC